VAILFDRGPTIELGDFRLLRDVINRFCGIEFSDDQRASVARKLRERLRALDLPDFKQYYHYLRYHVDAQAELERAAELLTTNETYFFREDYQLRGFRDEILPRLRESLAGKRTNRLAIWSAGCSTGEEVYTLAMLIAKSGLFDDWNVRVFGNDISRRVLHTARRAVYGSSSFRAMPEEFASYFVDMPDGKQVHPRIRAMCHFGHLNLLERDRTAVVGRVDAIFCRNVLIYFDDRSRRSVIDTFYERLSPGGYLLLGHSESLLNLSTAFELVHLKTDLVYKKPDVPQPKRGRSDSDETRKTPPAEPDEEHT
jgi:chemotaxis protein methyltransferase CheR